MSSKYDINRERMQSSYLVLLIHLVLCVATSQKQYKAWLDDFGHDTFQYPEWVEKQRKSCVCKGLKCSDESGNNPVTGRGNELTWCIAKNFLLNHMPEFDKQFLPPAVSVTGDSMLDDQIAFALMANNASKFMKNIPLAVQLSYILPYAGYHEARVNWRPLFFAKFFQLVENASSTVEAMSYLVAPNVILDWPKNVWEAHPSAPNQNDYTIEWSSSTSPPVINPFAFTAYGYASCSGWATFVTYVARSVGIPARQVGTPCWNAPLGGVDYRGLAKDNPNVSVCWHGGIGSKNGGVGGNFLNNHNWVEYWDDENSKWVFQNVPPQRSKPDSDSLCHYNESTGCNYDPKYGCSKVAGGPAAAMRDHEIFAITWSDPHGSDTESSIDGGAVIDVKDLKLSSGESVSPLVWSPRLSSPLGVPLKNVGLRIVNRTDFYRCKEP